MPCNGTERAIARAAPDNGDGMFDHPVGRNFIVFRVWFSGEGKILALKTHYRTIYFAWS